MAAQCLVVRVKRIWIRFCVFPYQGVARGGAPRKKPEGCGFDSLTMDLGSTQPLTEMSTKNISWGVKA